jgi:hypothetical protein
LDSLTIKLSQILLGKTVPSKWIYIFHKHLPGMEEKDEVGEDVLSQLELETACMERLDALASASEASEASGEDGTSVARKIFGDALPIKYKHDMYRDRACMHMIVMALSRSVKLSDLYTSAESLLLYCRLQTINLFEDKALILIENQVGDDLGEIDVWQNIDHRIVSWQEKNMNTNSAAARAYMNDKAAHADELSPEDKAFMDACDAIMRHAETCFLEE